MSIETEEQPCIYNATPHPVVLRSNKSELKTFPQSGFVLRCDSEYEPDLPHIEDIRVRGKPKYKLLRLPNEDWFFNMLKSGDVIITSTICLNAYYEMVEDERLKIFNGHTVRLVVAASGPKECLRSDSGNIIESSYFFQ